MPAAEAMETKNFAPQRERSKAHQYERQQQSAHQRNCHPSGAANRAPIPNQLTAQGGKIALARRRSAFTGES